MFKTLYCNVLAREVTAIVDLEGCVVRIACPEFDHAGHVCRRRQAEHQNGPLAELLDRAASHAFGARAERCQFQPL